MLYDGIFKGFHAAKIRYLVIGGISIPVMAIPGLMTLKQIAGRERQD